MLIAVKDVNFTSIGKTILIRTRIQQHNSGLGSISIEPLHIRLYALFACICEFYSKIDILFYVEQLRKEIRDRLIINGANDVKSWALWGSELIMDIDGGGWRPA